MSIKDWCTEYSQLDRKSKELLKELKDIKKDKKELEDKIQAYLEEHKKEGLVCDGQIYRNTKTIKHKALTKGEKDHNILQILEKHLPEDDILRAYDEIKEALISKEETQINKIIISKR